MLVSAHLERLLAIGQRSTHHQGLTLVLFVSEPVLIGVAIIRKRRSFTGVNLDPSWRQRSVFTSASIRGLPGA